MGNISAVSAIQSKLHKLMHLDTSRILQKESQYVKLNLADLYCVHTHREHRYIYLIEKEIPTLPQTASLTITVSQFKMLNPCILQLRLF